MKGSLWKLVVVSMISELCFLLLQTVSLTGIINGIERYGIIVIISLIINLVFFVSYTFNVLQKDKLFRWSIMPLLLLNVYSAILNGDIYTIFWIYILYPLISMNIYAISKASSVFSNKIVKLLKLYVVVLITTFVLVRSALSRSDTIGPISYLLLICSPVAMLNMSKKKIYLFLFVLFLVCFLSAKRGAFVSFVIASMITFFLNWKNKSNSFSSILKMFIFVVIGIVSFNLISNYSGGLMRDRLVTMYDDQGSGRESIHEAVLLNYLSSSNYDKIWGHGNAAVVGDDIFQGLSAHNDFIEILYDYGIIGVIFYLLIYVALLVLLVIFVKNDEKLFFSCCFFLFVTLLISLFSHIIIYPRNYFLFFLTFSILLSYVGSQQWRNENTL